MSALISPEGKILTKAIYEDIEANELNETCAKPCFIVLKKDRYGIIDDKGKQILDAQYDEISGVYNNKIALLQKGAFWGAMDIENRKAILEFKYEALSMGADGNIYFQKAGETGYFDAEGNKITR